jgi:hypothetical protein
MATHILRGFLTPNGTVELLDLLPEGIPDAQEVAVLVQTESPTLYKRLNEYGDSVWVDTVNGIEYPEPPFL